MAEGSPKTKSVMRRHTLGGPGNKRLKRCVVSSRFVSSQPRSPQPALAPHRYARYNETSFVEETFEQALRRGRLRDLPAVLVVTSYGDPPRFPLDWINRQPWPAFVSTKVGVGFHFDSGACDESPQSWGGVENLPTDRHRRRR